MGTMIDERNADPDPVGQLLRLAGPRKEVAPERTRRVKAVVHDAWRRDTRARSRRIGVARSMVALATAALVLVVVRLALRDGATPESPGPALATVEAASGPLGLHVGDTVGAGSPIDTSAGGRAALRTVGGVVVRVDRGTRLQFISASVLALDQGTIYVDASAGGSGPGALEIRTRLGVARDIGTRFEVRFDRSALRVRVREGRVQLTQGQTSHEGAQGDELTLDAAGRLVRRTVPVHGVEWAWAATLARPFELEGRTLREFLDWISAENGWQLRFTNAEVERKAAVTTLHGSIRGLTAEEALAAVLPTSGAEHQLDDGALTIRLSPAEAAD